VSKCEGGPTKTSSRKLTRQRPRRVTADLHCNIVTFTCGSDVTGFDAVRVGRGMPRAPVPFWGCGGTPHGRGSFAERTVSGGRLSGRGKGVAKQTGVATRGALFTLCTNRVLVPSGAGTFRGRCP
jgi:hypothetical protein